MKPLLVCYYDNIIHGRNAPANAVYELFGALLDWIESHNAFLIIKTKERAAYWGWTGEQKWWKLWRIWGRNQPKFIYKSYPLDLQQKMQVLEAAGKLHFEFGRGNILPGLKSDVIVVLPEGEIVASFWGYHKRILFFDIKGKFTEDIKFFYQPEDIGKELDKLNENLIHNP